MTAYPGRCYFLAKITNGQKLVGSKFLADLKPLCVFDVSRGLCLHAAHTHTLTLLFFLVPAGKTGICYDSKPNGAREVAHVMRDLNFVARSLFPCFLDSKFKFSSREEFLKIDLQELCKVITGHLPIAASRHVVSFCQGARSRSVSIAGHVSNVLQGVEAISTILASMDYMDWENPFEIAMPEFDARTWRVAAHNALHAKGNVLKKGQVFLADRHGR